MHHKQVDKAMAGDNVGLNIKGAKPCDTPVHCCLRWR